MESQDLVNIVLLKVPYSQALFKHHSVYGSIMKHMVSVQWIDRFKILVMGRPSLQLNCFKHLLPLSD